ncbi:hypothetical protein HDZ31DRAFT_85011 [Schizophyllum fasciatum]
MPFPLAILGTDRESAANLLRPYIEAGRLTYGDAERTLNLVSADKTIFHRAVVPATVGTAVSVLLYGAMSRRNYPLGKRIMIPGAVGTILGEAITIKRLRDDYAGWREGLTDEPAMREVLRELMYTSNRRKAVPQPSQTQGFPQQQDQGEAPTDRWSELRKEAGVTQPSSWDALRQSKGRAGLPPPTAPATPTGAQAAAAAPFSEQPDMTPEERRFKELMDRENRPSM